MWGCDHKWKQIMKTCSPPSRITSGCTLTDKMAEKILFGFVVILWECTECKEIRKEEMLGKEVKGDE